MKNIKQTHPATWLAGGAIALSASAADAALVLVAIGDGVRSLDSNSASSSFGNSVGVNDVLTVDVFAFNIGTWAKLSVAFQRVASDYITSGGFWDRAAAGGAYGHPEQALTGLSSITLDLVGSGTAEGWLVVTNDSTRFGNTAVTHFIFNDEDLSDGDGSSDGAATLAGFNNGDYATVATVAAIPEPSSLALLALGAGGVMLRRRRKAEAA